VGTTAPTISPAAAIHTAPAAIHAATTAIYASTIRGTNSR